MGRQKSELTIDLKSNANIPWNRIELDDSVNLIDLLFYSDIPMYMYDFVFLSRKLGALLE